MRSSVFLLLTAASVISACAEESSAPVETQTRRFEPAAADEVAPQGIDPDQERALKQRGKARGISKRVSTIDWDEAKAYPTGNFDGLSDEQLAKLVGSPVPALVPDRPELWQSATITKGEHWYAASLDGDAHSVYVSGTRLETVVPGLALPDERPGLKDDFRITRNELIVSLTFNAFGAAYVLEVECARPSIDPRCTKDEYAVELANALVLPKGGQ